MALGAGCFDAYFAEGIEEKYMRETRPSIAEIVPNQPVNPQLFFSFFIGVGSPSSKGKEKRTFQGPGNRVAEKADWYIFRAAPTNFGIW